DLDLAQRRQHAVLGGRHRQRLPLPLSRLQLAARLAGPERPSAFPVDLHRDDLVAGRFQRFGHRAGGRDRDLVLARPAAHQHGYATASHGVGFVPVVSVGVDWVGGGATYLPTVMVTVDFGFASVPASGLWLITWPSSLGSVVSMVWTATLKPAPRSRALADCASSPLTSGMVIVFGPLDTSKVTVVPLGSCVLPLGSWPSTVSFGWSESC